MDLTIENDPGKPPIMSALRNWDESRMAKAADRKVSKSRNFHGEYGIEEQRVRGEADSTENVELRDLRRDERALDSLKVGARKSRISRCGRKTGSGRRGENCK